MALGIIALAIIALFLPPITVLLKRGCGGQFLLNIILTCLAWLPGVLHAWWVLADSRDREKEVRRSGSRTSSRSRRRSHEKYSAPAPAHYSAQQHHVYPPPQPATHAYGQGGNGYGAAPVRKY